jgi:hypothetical protein
MIYHQITCLGFLAGVILRLAGAESEAKPVCEPRLFLWFSCSECSWLQAHLVPGTLQPLINWAKAYFGPSPIQYIHKWITLPATGLFETPNFSDPFEIGIEILTK